MASVIAAMEAMNIPKNKFVQMIVSEWERKPEKKQQDGLYCLTRVSSLI